MILEVCVPGGINRRKLSILSEYFKKYLVGLRLSNSAGPYKSPINSSIRSEFSESFHRSIPPGTHTSKITPAGSIPPGELDSPGMDDGLRHFGPL